MDLCRLLVKEEGMIANNSKITVQGLLEARLHELCAISNADPGRQGKLTIKLESAEYTSESSFEFPISSFATAIPSSQPVPQYSLGREAALISDENRIPVDIHKICDLFTSYVELPSKSGRKAKKCSLETAHRYLSLFHAFIKRHDLSTFEEMCEFLDSYSFEKENNARRKSNEKRITESGGWRAMLRCCASIFGEKALAYYSRHGINLHNPFIDFEMKAEVKRYIPPISGEKFWQCLTEEIVEDGDLYKIAIFLICLGTGTRIQECTHLKWKHIFYASVDGRFMLKISSDKIHQTKSKRPREVAISNEIAEFLISFRPDGFSPEDWIIPDERAPRNAQRKERCHGVAKRLRSWLKTHGITDSRPIHYLRKAYGAEVANKHSIYLASEYLGHSTIDLTRHVYAAPTEHWAPPARLKKKHKVAMDSKKKNKSQSSKQETRVNEVLTILRREQPVAPRELLVMTGFSRSTLKRVRNILLSRNQISVENQAKSTTWRLRPNS